MNDTLKFLDSVKDRLEEVSYEEIYQSVATMRDKFVPTALIKKVLLLIGSGFIKSQMTCF
jgi:hypothetical protein